MKLECNVCKVLDIVKHSNADTLSVVSVLGYKCITKLKADNSFPYNVGDYIVYIPESALLPTWLLKEMELWNHTEDKGMLFGTSNNRVKAIKLRGQYSEGLLYPVVKSNGKLFITKSHISDTEFKNDYIEVIEGQDVSEYFGITKWEPPIPIQLAGTVGGGLSKYVVKYDIESLQKYPDVLNEGETVEFTEKIHGCASYNDIIEIVDVGKVKIGHFIENIYKKDNKYYVKSYNHTTKEIEYRQILGTSVKKDNKDWYEIIVEVNNKEISLELTGNHLIWCENLNAYRSVRDLVGNESVLVDIE